MIKTGLDQHKPACALRMIVMRFTAWRDTANLRTVVRLARSVMRGTKRRPVNGHDGTDALLPLRHAYGT